METRDAAPTSGSISSSSNRTAMSRAFFPVAATVV
jgi:hypothetical protein